MIDLYELLKIRIKNKPNVFDTKGMFYNEMREIFQELLLNALSQTKFFENNAFQGGTALRLIHKSKRYSEDLDFNMKKDDPGFSWDYYFNVLNDYCKNLGFEVIKIERESRVKNKLKSLVVNGKDIIGIIHDKGIAPMDLTKVIKRQNIIVKLETGFYNSRFNAEYKTLLFPEIFPVEVFDIHCLFAGKLHAILNRSKNVNVKDKNTGETVETHREDENKGRDWYDFISYIKLGIEPNWRFLKEKLKEIGKWEGQDVNADEKWLKEQLKLKMKTLDFKVMEKELLDYLELNDDFEFNEGIAEEYINIMGSGGYKVKYNKDDDDWDGGNSGITQGNVSNKLDCWKHEYIDLENSNQWENMKLKDVFKCNNFGIYKKEYEGNVNYILKRDIDIKNIEIFYFKVMPSYEQAKDFLYKWDKEQENKRLKNKVIKDKNSIRDDNTGNRGSGGGKKI